MTGRERIEGLVASLLSKRELVINKGQVDGVRIGMRFKVLDSVGVEVEDPVSGQSLGAVEVAKTIVKVVQVDARMCVARTFREYQVGGLFENLTQTVQTRVETFGGAPDFALDEMSGSPVAKGDRVVQLLADDDPVVRPPK